MCVCARAHVSPWLRLGQRLSSPQVHLLKLAQGCSLFSGQSARMIQTRDTCGRGPYRDWALPRQQKMNQHTERMWEKKSPERSEDRGDEYKINSSSWSSALLRASLTRNQRSRDWTQMSCWLSAWATSLMICHESSEVIQEEENVLRGKRKFGIRACRHTQVKTYSWHWYMSIL